MRSRSGPSGGWQLLVDPATTTLADVWRAVYGDGQLLGIHSANPDCVVGQGIQVALANIDRDAARAVEAELEATTLARLVTATAQAA